MEHWQDQDPSSAPAAPARDPVAWEPYNIIAELRALGVLKSNEKPVVLHCYTCPFPQNYSAACQCPGGPEIVWPDWDELKPVREYTTPERFYDNRH